MAQTHTGAGAEPGINPRRDSAFKAFGHIRQQSVVAVTDYSSDVYTTTTYTNAEFIDVLADPQRSTRVDGAAVRWINIGGLSWDVISAVALKYDLHSLALEDILQEQGHNHSKADYYPNHLFLRVLCHTLGRDDDDDASHPATPSDDLSASVLVDAVPFARPSSPSSMHLSDYEKDTKDRAPPSPRRFDFLRRRLAHKTDEEGVVRHFGKHELRNRLSGLTGFRTAARQRRIMRIQQLKKGDRVNVRLAPIYMFLLRDGTVITMHSAPSLVFTQPIVARLHEHDSVLRTSADASLLIESILDLVVDRVLEVIDAYQDRIHELENEILLKPTMNTVRSLHILSGDLILHKRTLDPIKTVVYGLRRYDLDRCAALLDMRNGAWRPPGMPAATSAASTPGSSAQSLQEHSRIGLAGAALGGAGAGVQGGQVPLLEGYMSYKAKIYLADVYDHMDFVLTSLDMFAGIAENLINYAFNMASYEMNETMRRLTLATIIFLPLTLLTGYFGMNFDRMWSVQNNSDLLFWIIALPVMGLLLPIFLYSDIANMVHYFRKRLAGERLAKRKF